MNEYKDYESKTICFLGDSITDGAAVNTGERYLDILGKELSFNAVGYGKNGACFSALENQVKLMETEQKDNVDAIFILAGTNDFYGSTPLGEWYTLANETVISARTPNGEPLKYSEVHRRDLCFDTSTFRGSINTIVSELKHTYAKKQIILMTPIHRAWACFGPTNIQYPENYSNDLGYFISDYVDAVREAAGLWSCELIDLWTSSGLLPIFDESAEAYFSNIDNDRLHPNKYGHMRMAKVIKAKLKTIPINL